MTACPTTDKLEQLLGGELSETDSQAVGQHVAECRRCQAALDGLTSAPEIDRMLDDSRASSLAVPDRGLFELLDRMRGTPPDPRWAEGPAEPRPPRDETIRFPGPATPDAPLGQLGTYDILEQLAGGASGLLFKARDSKLGRIVAIKVLRRELAAMDRARARFEREARAAASLNHDHIVTVYDVVTPSDFPPYLVMEHIAGESLADRVRRDKLLEPADAAQIVRQVALGLAAAHERGLVHRDIKPSNIMLDQVMSRAKLTDFGLARAPESAAGITQEGAIAGTPAYMSPEQMTSPQEVDGRCDVYGLGVVLYELLTGDLPFRGVTRMILLQVLHDDPSPPRRLNDKIPGDLETICLKAMAKEPARRYSTAAEFSDDLGRFLAGEPIRARPIGVVEWAWRWSRRNPLIASLGTAVLMLLVTVAVGSSLAAIRIGAASDQTKSALRSANKAQREAELAQKSAEGAREVADELRQQAVRALDQERQARAEAETAKQQIAVALDREKKSARDAQLARMEAEAAQKKTAAALERERDARDAAERARQDAQFALQVAEESARIADEQRELALRSLNRLGAAALDVLLQDPSGLEKAGRLDAAIVRYEEAISLIRQNRLVGIPPLVVHSQIVAPALRLGQRLKLEESGESGRRRLAAIHAFQARLIVDHSGEAWPMPMPLRSAVESFDQAAQLDPSDLAHVAGRADARLKAFELEKTKDPSLVELAAADLQQVHKISPSRPILGDLFSRLGKAHHSLGEFDKADAAFRQAAELASRDDPHIQIDSLRDRAWTAISAGRLDQARRYAEQLKPLDAPAAALVIGETYERENLVEKAMESYDSGLPTELARAETAHVLLLAAAAQARIRTANDLATPKTQAAELRSTAVAQLRAAIKLAPQHSRAWFWRGLLARQLKMFLDSASDPQLQAGFRREANELLDQAVPAAPPEGRPDLVRLQRELNTR
jgi:serine/threonine protein kinase